MNEIHISPRNERDTSGQPGTVELHGAWSHNNETQERCFHLTVEDGISGVALVDVLLSAEDFMTLVSGSHAVAETRRAIRPERIGRRQQVASQTVSGGSLEEREAAAEAIVRELREQGWAADKRRTNTSAWSITGRRWVW